MPSHAQCSHSGTMLDSLYGNLLGSLPRRFLCVLVSFNWTVLFKSLPPREVVHAEASIRLFGMALGEAPAGKQKGEGDDIFAEPKASVMHLIYLPMMIMTRRHLKALRIFVSCLSI